MDRLQNKTHLLICLYLNTGVAEWGSLISFTKCPFILLFVLQSGSRFLCRDWLFSQKRRRTSRSEEDVSVCGLLIRKIICGDIFLHNPRLFWRCLQFFISVTFTVNVFLKFVFLHLMWKRCLNTAAKNSLSVDCEPVKHFKWTWAGHWLKGESRVLYESNETTAKIKPVNSPSDLNV